MTNTAELAAYLRRIGLLAPPPPTPDGLAAMQRAHREAIGFENIDILLGRGVRIDMASIRAKLIDGQRGGYCFEHNTLFGAMLAAVGLPSRPLLARVWLRAEHGEAPPRTHTLRLVDIAGEAWLGDAGFGTAFVPPLPLVDGAETVSPDGMRHRLRVVSHMGAIGGAWMLERQAAGQWQAQYGFDTAEVAPIDLEQANHWTSSRPATRFTQGAIVSIVLPDGFASLAGRRLTIEQGGRHDVIEIADAADWRARLADMFHITLSADEVAALGLF